MNGTYAIGRVLDLRFTLPSADTFIMCSAVVRHQRLGQGIGVEFLGLSPETRGQIENSFGREASLMSLTSGTTLGPYQILSPLGAGGMDI